MGFNPHECSELRNVLQALQFITHIKEENGKSDLYELHSLTRLTMIVDGMEEAKESFDPPCHETQTQMMELTVELLRALLASNSTVSLKQVARPLVEQNPDV